MACKMGGVLKELLPLAEKVAALLKARHQTIAVAESSAGGLINAALLALPGASAYCKGGMVMYTRDALLSLKNVDRSMLQGIRGLSEPYGLLKARVIREHLLADWGLSESGAAGPQGNKYGNNAGHCVIAVAGVMEKTRTIQTGLSDRQVNMVKFAQASLSLLLESLEAAP